MLLSCKVEEDLKNSPDLALVQIIAEQQIIIAEHRYSGHRDILCL